MSLKHINILLADDDPDDCHFFKLALEQLPISTQLTSVPDGEKIMEFLSNAQNILPDVIFLDLNMPRKNGFECLSEIKGNKKLRHLPVIIFSTSLEQETVGLLYQNGANYYIRKPSEFLNFRKTIEYLLMSHIVTQDVEQPSRENFVITAFKLNLL